LCKVRVRYWNETAGIWTPVPEITNMILRKLFQVKIQSGFFSNVVTQPDLQVLHSWSLLILWGVSVKSFQESLEEKNPSDTS